MGMADVVYCRGPWSIKVLPCFDEFMCEWAAESEESFFYFYKTLFSKLGIMLLFTKFEQAALCSLNIAPTQLHPNTAGRTRLSVLFDDVGDSLFPMYWTDQPAISVSVDWDELQDWEDKFVEERGRISSLSCSNLISNKGGYSIKDIVAMRECSSRFTTPSVAEASPLSVTQLAEERTQPPPVAMEKEFRDLVAHQDALSTKNKKAYDASLKLNTEYADSQVKINNRDVTTNLQGELDWAVVEMKELRLAQQDLESSRDYFRAQTKILQKEKEAMVSAKVFVDEEISWLKTEIEARDHLLTKKDALLDERGFAIAEQFEEGFTHALREMAFLHPDLDMSVVGTFKEVADRKLVDIEIDPPPTD
ncbi:hypothetical protein CR513_49891, partial [Mucuna pruriens]